MFCWLLPEIGGNQVPLLSGLNLVAKALNLKVTFFSKKSLWCDFQRKDTSLKDLEQGSEGVFRGRKGEYEKQNGFEKR